ncbi:hypothetical protein BDQ17DRAFT_1275644, partial [Cyathus striatus]
MMGYVSDKIVFPCFKVSYMCACATGIGMGICCICVVLLSRFRIGRYWESSSIVWSHTSPFFLLSGFYILFTFALLPWIAIIILITPMLFDIAKEEPILYLSLVLMLGGMVILGAGLMWLFRGT